MKRLPDGETARNVILSDEIVGAVVHACYKDAHDLGVFVETLAATGARESQVLRLEVADLQDDPFAPRLMMPSSKKGRNRRIERKPLPISPRLARRRPPKLSSPFAPSRQRRYCDRESISCAP